MPLPPRSACRLPTGTLTRRERGAGPPVVFLHGLGGNAASWEAQFDGLSPHHRVIAWDAPGYGGSDDHPVREPTVEHYADTLAALLDALGLDMIDLVGHSMGGAVAAGFAARWPNRVRRLVLSCTRASFAGPHAAAFRERLGELQTLPTAEFGRRRAVGMAAASTPPAIVDRLAAVAGEVRASGYAAAVHLLSRADNRASLPRLDRPCLVVAGAEDRIAPRDAAEELARMIPGARLEVVGKAGHAPYLEQAETYNALLRGFFGRG